jgi:hypothetical protein
LNPELHGSIENYTQKQIKTSEENLVHQALHFKQKLKNLDAYPVNAIGAGASLPSNY